MNYPIEDLERDIFRIVADLSDLRKAKGHDYAGDEDTFSDLRPLGVDYCLKRLIQKCFRALHLLESPAMVAESIEHEFGDIINFALYCPILHRHIKRETNDTDEKPKISPSPKLHELGDWPGPGGSIHS